MIRMAFWPLGYSKIFLEYGGWIKKIKKEQTEKVNTGWWGIAGDQLKVSITQVLLFGAICSVCHTKMWLSFSNDKCNGVLCEKQLHYWWHCPLFHWWRVVTKFNILDARRKISKTLKAVHLEEEAALNLMKFLTLFPFLSNSKSWADWSLRRFVYGTSNMALFSKILSSLR
jgi:hypothetical protein